jgi:tRNA(Glu) U13 pseudouridine synthase TruD
MKDCVYCHKPLQRYGAQSHLVCHKKHIGSRMNVFDRDPTENKKWRKWFIDRFTTDEKFRERPENILIARTMTARERKRVKPFEAIPECKKELP